MSSIILKNVNLDYVIKSGSDSLKKVLANIVRTLAGKKPKNILARHSVYRALTDINLTFNQGDRIAIVGKNGAGKSTLLRVLAKVYKPAIGSIHVEGKIAGLFDIGLGINDEATGYENIINLAILRGYSKKDACSIIADVEEFTELGEFLYSPVRTYSSGMRMKLAFAVATAFVPDILLLDEVIVVGDARFMKKAAKRMEALIENAQILVMTSHSEEIVRQFCNKILFLEYGKVKYFGEMEEGLKRYKESLDLVVV